jgi:hypothetical protein
MSIKIDGQSQVLERNHERKSLEISGEIIVKTMDVFNRNIGKENCLAAKTVNCVSVEEPSLGGFFQSLLGDKKPYKALHAPDVHDAVEI